MSTKIATYGPLTKFGYKDFCPHVSARSISTPQRGSTSSPSAGARYVVPVAEHCDGFAMYASDMTPWNAAAAWVRTAVRRRQELAIAATRARGLPLRRLLAHRRSTGGGMARAAPFDFRCARRNGGFRV